LLERLIENWLDNAGERTYQPCFCQMLIGRGYRIVHNTEHTPLEHGKDIIAISPEGKLVGFQLKGNPGKSLKPSQFDDIRGQLEQLATLALGLPGYEKKVPDECYLVTNGEIDEAVSIEIQRLNAALEARGHPPERIKTIARGTMQALAKDLGLALWPSEMEDFGNLVKLLNCEGDEIFPAEIFDPLLQNTLRLPHNVPAPDLRRRITSAAIMTAVALHSFSRKRNHFAEITAWMMFATYTIAACEKNGLDYKKDAEEAVLTARDAIYGLLGQLSEELRDRATLAEGDPFSEYAFYRARALLVYALMGIYWMWSETEGWKHPDHKALIEKVIPEQLPASIWGEAAVPQYLTYIWYRKRISRSSELDLHIAYALRDVMGNKLADKADHLASPYYDIEDVTRHGYAELLRCDDPFGGGSFAGTSYVCESLMMCLVRAGLKDACKELWPDFTRMTHEKSIPDQAWSFGLYRMGDHAAGDTKIYPRTMQWRDLQEIMAEHEGDEVPQALKNDPILLLLFINTFPFRASFSALKFLHKKFDTPVTPSA
jgi:hypothetical protein